MYVLDSNAIAELFRSSSSTYQRMRIAVENDDILYLCQPVYFEVLRGLLHPHSTRKLRLFQEGLIPLLTRIEVMDADWEQAARFWATSRATGRQFSDVDLLIAALTVRLNATLVSADADFDALPIRREDWR